MATEIVSFQRDFQIWSYTVGHSRLLLRSTKTEKESTRIDILFKDVGGVVLPTILNEVMIVELSEIPEFPNFLKNVSSRNRKIFMINGKDFSGYVLAGALGWHVDYGEYDDPSSLL